MKTCPFCHYNLSGTRFCERCPECGNCVVPDHIQAVMQHPMLRDELALCMFAAVGWFITAAVILLAFSLTGGPLFMLLAAAGAFVLGAASIAMSSWRRRRWPAHFAHCHPNEVTHSAWYTSITLYVAAAYFVPATAACLQLLSR